MSWAVRGNVVLQLTNTGYGFSFSDWSSLINANNREFLYKTPRCQRIRQWNVDERLQQLSDAGY